MQEYIGHKNDIFCSAVERGSVKIVEKMVDMKDVDVNTCESFPIKCGCQLGYIEIVKILLGSDRVVIDLKILDFCLCAAINNGDNGLFKVLLDDNSLVDMIGEAENWAWYKNYLKTWKKEGMIELFKKAYERYKSRKME